MLAIALALQVTCSPFGTCAQRQLAPTDSQRIERGARSAQQQFERIRRDHLPWIGGGSSDYCDEIVNFHCFTYGDPEEVWKPPKEEPEVVAARDSLILALRRAFEALPADRWIIGQLVRYLLDAGQEPKAREAGSACRPAESWWCLAFVGSAAHQAGDFVAAESAFERMLSAMSSAQRCEWTDISLLLQKAPGKAYRDLDCEARNAVERRFWWLADPLFLTPGNERRSEHFARHVQVWLESDAPPVSRTAAMQTMDPWLIRYGSPSGWERQESHSLSVEPEPGILTHYRGPTQVFEPSWKALSLVTALTPDDLPLRPEGAKTGYVPKYAERFDTLSYQVAVFHDADSATIVAGYDFTSDSIPRTAPVLAGLFLSSNEQGPPYGQISDQLATGFLALRAPLQSGIVSVETKAVEKPRAGRMRMWRSIERMAPNGIGMSDLLLLSRADSLPRNLAEAIPLARTGTIVSPGESLGLYWEVYGLGPNPVPLSVSVTLVKEGTGWLRRAARSLKLVGADKAKVSLNWSDMSQPGSAALAGTIALNLGKNEPGRYTLRVEVSGQPGKAAAQREIIISQE